RSAIWKEIRKTLSGSRSQALPSSTTPAVLPEHGHRRKGRALCCGHRSMPTRTPRKVVAFRRARRLQLPELHKEKRGRPAIAATAEPSHVTDQCAGRG